MTTTEPARPVESDSRVEDEQRHIDVLYRRLDEMRATTQRRLSQVLLDGGGTPQARSERESYTQLYSEDLTKFDAAEHGLCFGRIDTDSGEVRHIGRLGIFDEDDDYHALLLDWRAPLARPFYLATAASREEVRVRRHLRLHRRTVTSVNDEYLVADAARPAEDTADVARESALLDALNAARTGHMNDIVSTIQREQDQIIRSEHRSVLVVQGGPGTGKTAVALHRAAYLLYTYRQQLSKSGVLIIGPGDTFLKYIEHVLPSLGETGVMLSTIGDLFPGVRAELRDGARASAIKGSLDMVTILKTAVRERQEVPRSQIELTFDGYPLIIDRAIVTRARGRARSSRRPHNLARPIFLQSALDALTDQMVSRIGSDQLGGANLLSREDIADIRSEIATDASVLHALGTLWPELTPQQVLMDLLASESRLAKAAPKLSDDDRASLLRGDHRGFSATDAPLLDELAELLGYDDEAERVAAKKRWRQQIEDAQGALDILTGSAPQDLEDELDPELLMAYDLIDAETLAGRQDERVHLTAAERAAADRTWTFGHVIVDEAQELSEMAWRMVMRRIPNRWMTLVGDTAQTGSAAGTDAWGSVLAPYVANRWKQFSLTVNYRTPAEIMALANAVLRQIDPTAVEPTSIRSSGEQPVFTRADDVTAEITSALAGFPDKGLIGVICAESALGALTDTLPPARDRVQYLSVRESKGLEFDHVIVVEPSQMVADSARGLNDLYVALTRATQRLHIIHRDALPDALT